MGQKKEPRNKPSSVRSYLQQGYQDNSMGKWSLQLTALLKLDTMKNTKEIGWTLFLQHIQKLTQNELKT